MINVNNLNRFLIWPNFVNVKLMRHTICNHTIQLILLVVLQSKTTYVLQHRPVTRIVKLRPVSTMLKNKNSERFKKLVTLSRAVTQWSVTKWSVVTYLV